MSQKPAFDPRRNAVREDLASAALKGKVSAAAFTEGTPAQVARAAVPLRRSPAASAAFETEALFGETLRVFDTADGWAWVQLDLDGYVGYVPANTLVPDIVTSTHRVKATGTFVYAEPGMKSPPVQHLSLNARLAVVETVERYSRLATGGYVVSRHCAELAWQERDFVDVAERFLGTPYLWGGRTRIGLDCSALVQLSLMASGFDAPRDSDMQRDELGTHVQIPADFEGLQRGDLIFWPGHVGIMSDGVMLLHANAHHMLVVNEPLPEASARITSAGGGEITAIRRLPGLTAGAPGGVG